jgi:hypothetical protein
MGSRRKPPGRNGGVQSTTVTVIVVFDPPPGRLRSAGGLSLAPELRLELIGQPVIAAVAMDSRCLP